MELSRLLKGACAGVAATVPMTAAMAVLAVFLPPDTTYALPPEKVTARITALADIWQRTTPQEHALLTALSHVGYGATIGAAYGSVTKHVQFPAVCKGIGYGLIVWAAGYSGWLPALGILPPPGDAAPSRNVQLIISHIVWGATLGLLLEQWHSPLHL